MIYSLIKDRHSSESKARLFSLILAIAGFALLAYLYPYKAETTAAKVLILTVAAVMAYIVDRILFPTLQTCKLRAYEDSIGERDLAYLLITIQIRRALIFFAMVLGLCLGIV